MGLIKKLSDAIQGRSKSTRVAQEISGQQFLNPICTAYENIFAQVRPLIDEMKMVRPYGVGRNGARLPLTRTPELIALDYPNDEMGWAEFIDAAYAIWLTEKELNIHAWKDSRGKIQGYTLLPVGSRVSLGNGDYYFQVYTADGGSQILYPDEVMTLRYSRSPRNLEQGVSPASSVFIWTQVDDLLAQYQRAFLENGAVPTSITIIRASTKEKYDAMRHEMEGQLKGAKNRNKTLYLWKQMLSNGEELDQVEVKPIQGNNSTLAIKEIMSIVNDKLNKAYGVSEFILGNDSSAKYDNAELSDRQFTKRRVLPALTSFWSQFQHELDRILGGLGYAIQFDLEIPELTDRLKVKAEISEKNAANLTNLIASGASPKSAVAALGLGDSWLDVAIGIYANKVKAAERAEAQMTLNLPSLTTGLDSAQNSQEKKEDSVHNSNKCTCHHTHNNKTDAEVSFTASEVRERTIYEELKKITDAIVAELTEAGVALTDEQLEEIKLAIIDQLSEAGADGMDDAAAQIKGYLAGADKNEITEVLKNGGYQVSKDFRERLAQRTDALVNSLNEEARKTATAIFTSARAEGGEPLTANELKKALADAMPAARAETIARNETVYAFRAGGLDNADQIAKKYHLKMKKTWHANPGACDICLAMDGQTVELREAFPSEVVGTDDDGKETTFRWKQDGWNNEGEISSAHVNCRCTILYEVEYD